VHEPLITEYLAILELLAIISSTLASKNYLFSLAYKNPSIPFFKSISISSFEILFS